jgi:hypothetical protein
LSTGSLLHKDPGKKQWWKTLFRLFFIVLIAFFFFFFFLCFFSLAKSMKVPTGLDRQKKKGVMGQPMRSGLYWPSKEKMMGRN